MDTDSSISIPLPLTPTVKRSLADDVVDRLRDAIFHGSFKPGEALREEQLAAMLDVSLEPDLQMALHVAEGSGSRRCQ